MLTFIKIIPYNNITNHKHYHEKKSNAIVACFGAGPGLVRQEAYI